MIRWVLCMLIVGALLSAAPAMEDAASCSDPAAESFVKWAREHAATLASVEPDGDTRELASLRQIVGNARVVGLGEAARRVHEFYAVRSRIFRYLVEEMGFSALVAETGLAEAAGINDYLLGREGEPAAWQNWFTFGYGDETELRNLLRWMRAYNQNPLHHRKIHFYGMDSMVVYSSPSTAVSKAIQYLDEADPAFRSSTTRADLLALTESMRGSGGGRRDMEVSLRKYVRLPVAQRDRYTATLADLLSRFDGNRLAYVGRSSEDAYAWARQFAVAARQLDSQYRAVAATLEPGEELKSNDVPGAIYAIRDAAMYENVSWALGREGSAGRVAVWAHNAHLSKGSVNDGTTGLAAVFASGPRLGMFLDSALRAGYVSIGTAFYEGKPGWQPAQGPAPCGTFDRQLANVGPSAFLLDLRPAVQNKVADAWFSAPRLIRADNPAADYRVDLKAAWDALVFVRQISPVHIEP